MDKLVLAVGPAFMAGFAVQHLLELLDPVAVKLVRGPANKKIVLSAVSLVVGLALALGAGLRVLGSFGVGEVGTTDAFDVLVTAMVISAGTDGFNSIVKFLGYAKEDRRARVRAATPSRVADGSLALVNRQPQPSLPNPQAVGLPAQN
jgi:hypothetical protein